MLPLSHRDVGVRLITKRDAVPLEKLLLDNRSWLEQWEATHPGLIRPLVPGFSLKPAIKNLLYAHRQGTTLPLVITYRDHAVGQLTASGIQYGSLSSAQLGYWISEDVAGRGITPVAVALASDYLMRSQGLHRIEICIRPENSASLRVVEKLGFRYEGRRPNYIHIDGRWRDHDSFALTAEDLPQGLLARYLGATARREV